MVSAARSVTLFKMKRMDREDKIMYVSFLYMSKH